jgi:hypothetical protein
MYSFVPILLHVLLRSVYLYEVNALLSHLRKRGATQLCPFIVQSLIL